MVIIMYTLPMSNLRKVRAAQLCNQDGHRLPFGIVDDQRRDKVVVPRAHKAEDGLHRHGGLEDWQDDRVEGVEFTRCHQCALHQ